MSRRLDAYAFLLVVACGGSGGSSFVPVTFVLEDWGSGVPIAEAVKKLNPSCAANCELGVAVEDGGCSSIYLDAGRFHNFPDGGSGRDPSTITCQPAVADPSNGLFLPFFESQALDGGAPYLSRPRNVAVGAELTFFLFGDGDRCRATFTVPSSGLAVTARQDQSGTCSFKP